MSMTVIHSVKDTMPGGPARAWGLDGLFDALYGLVEQN